MLIMCFISFIVLIRNYPNRLYEKVPKIMVPMLWFTQRATLTTELAKQAKVEESTIVTDRISYLLIYY